MSYMYGSVDLTVTGQMDKLNQVAAFIQTVEYDGENAKKLQQEFLRDWNHALSNVEPDSDGHGELFLNSFYEVSHIAVQLIGKIGYEFSDLEMFCEADMSDSITDEEGHFLLRKPAGSTEWEDDDFLLEMADSYW